MTTNSESLPRLGKRQQRCLRWLVDIEEWDPNDYTRTHTHARLRSTMVVFGSLAKWGLAEPTQQGVMYPLGGGFIWGYRITDYGRELAASCENL